MTNKEREKVDKFEIAAPSSSAVTIVVEPWGAEYVLQPGSRFEATFRGPAEGDLAQEEAEGVITLYAWPGAVYSAHKDGVLIRESSPVVPSLPRGMTMQEFLRLHFKKEQS